MPTLTKEHHWTYSIANTSVFTHACYAHAPQPKHGNALKKCVKSYFRTHSMLLWCMLLQRKS